MAAPTGGTHHQDPAYEPAAEDPAPVGKFRAAPDGFNYRAPFAASFTMTSSAIHGAPRTSPTYSDIAHFSPSEVPLSPPTKETQLLLQHTHQPLSPTEFYNGYFMGRRPNGQGSYGLVFHPTSGHLYATPNFDKSNFFEGTPTTFRPTGEWALVQGSSLPLASDVAPIPSEDQAEWLEDPLSLLLGDITTFNAKNS